MAAHFHLSSSAGLLDRNSGYLYEMILSARFEDIPVPIAFENAGAPASMPDRGADLRQIKRDEGTPRSRFPLRRRVSPIPKVDDRTVPPPLLLDFPEPKESGRNCRSYRHGH